MNFKTLYLVPTSAIGFPNDKLKILFFYFENIAKSLYCKHEHLDAYSDHFYFTY